MVPLPYEALSLPVSPPQLVEDTLLVVKVLEVVAEGAVPAAAVEFNPVYVVVAAT
jgi:hypothetical protein